MVRSAFSEFFGRSLSWLVGSSLCPWEGQSLDEWTQDGDEDGDEQQIEVLFHQHAFFWPTARGRVTDLCR